MNELIQSYQQTQKFLKEANHLFFQEGILRSCTQKGSNWCKDPCVIG